MDRPELNSLISPLSELSFPPLFQGTLLSTEWGELPACPSLSPMVSHFHSFCCELAQVMCFFEGRLFLLQRLPVFSLSFPPPYSVPICISIWISSFKNFNWVHRSFWICVPIFFICLSQWLSINSPKIGSTPNIILPASGAENNSLLAFILFHSCVCIFSFLLCINLPLMGPFCYSFVAIFQCSRIWCAT